ncbi:ABC transporter permease [Lottiidibacillus patelloidae]|uniref:ABC transporter permease n=1 Tax=Lottiidibacillus patelloidae TaxID=2670334 RepID=A0A263BUE4_9BACI|nr:iron ABC transporter permease [Lottiidibacillus patelloidae]OZM57162.1 ABC transporter permease [Lottiidibacillus patelloidae]
MQRLSIQKLSQNKNIFVILISTTFLLLACLLAISIGSVHIPIKTIVTLFIDKLFFNEINEDYSSFEKIIFQLRLPRVLLAALVGASLACAGAAIQGLLKNPLGDPYILGVSSGASVGAVIVLFFGLSLPVLATFTLPIVSILFGFITIFLVLSFSQLVDKQLRVETIILTGVIFSSFLSSLVSLMLALSKDELRTIIYWLLGSVSVKGWPYILAILPFFLIGVLVLVLNSRALNSMAFGEETAYHLGINMKRRKVIILIGTSILTGAAVAVSGIIGFVGLVIPHITRMFTGADHHLLIPISLINGATFLVLTDLIARTVIAPSEIPIGVMTALVGAPLFAYIFFRQRKERRV